MDQSKEEILGNIQRLNVRVRQQAADLRGQREQLKEIDDELPAKQEMVENLQKQQIIMTRLRTQRQNSVEYLSQLQVVQEAAATLETSQDSLSANLVLYMVKTKKKSVHASADDPESVDREIVTSARIGKKVPNNVSLFDEVEE